MNPFDLHNPAAPWEILLEMLLDGSQGDLSATLVRDIVMYRRKLTLEDCKGLATIFDTTYIYWMNLQTNYDNSLLNDPPMKDYAKEVLMPLSAINHTIKSGTPTRTYLNEDKSKPVYVLTERAYKHFVSKCTETEAWETGILGMSEEHSVSVGMPEKLQQILKYKKLESLIVSFVEEVDHTGLEKYITKKLDETYPGLYAMSQVRIILKNLYGVS